MPCPSAEGAASLPDDLDGHPVKVRQPEAQSDLSSAPVTQHLAQYVPGGQLGGESLLRLRHDEDEHLPGGRHEADLGVVDQRPGGVLTNLVTVDPGP